MADEPPNSSVVVLAPRPQDFIERVRALAADSKRVKWTNHALERMQQRGITTRVALTVVREGVTVGAIEPGRSPGEWKAKIVRNVKGRRDVGVVVLLVKQSHLTVKTVEWEDLR